MNMELELSVASEPETAGSSAIDAASADPAPLETVPDATPVEPLAAGLQVDARLIEYAPGRRIALPPHTTYALIDHPAVETVPGAAGYAYGLTMWQGNRLALLDLNVLFHGDAGAVLSAAPRYALIIAYQSVARGPLAYGAIAMNALPQTIAVGDEAHCALPGDSKLWPQLALSCFQHEGQAVPIIDTSRLFGAWHG
jgi:hypothetical protein